MPAGSCSLRVRAAAGLAVVRTACKACRALLVLGQRLAGMKQILTLLALPNLSKVRAHATATAVHAFGSPRDAVAPLAVADAGAVAVNLPQPPEVAGVALARVAQERKTYLVWCGSGRRHLL